jgi:glyoxylase-like metal-dependent hydrolase (beta-lactamase superfamily II)
MLVKETDKLQIYMYEIEIENTGHITNTYVIKDKVTNKLAVIDPAFNGNCINDNIKKLGILESVIITHSHADHIAGLAEIVNDTDVKVYIHYLDKAGLYDGVLNEELAVKTKVKQVNIENVCDVFDESIIVLGETKFKVMHTPGHTSGSIIIYNIEEDVLFAGDTIFKNTYGRTDLITSSTEDMGKSLGKIFNTFKDISVYSGHGEVFKLENSKRRIKLLFAFKNN